ncbi:YraN family protein [Fontibacillus sp. BL9]|uniref:YraN family protein n=1 Tax=Fontibacillus sp. BL9 TaxID=3389971 RepID=UPI0039788DE0
MTDRDLLRKSAASAPLNESAKHPAWAKHPAEPKPLLSADASVTAKLPASSYKRSKDGRKARGRWAEQLAEDYLKKQGYKIVERNWRCRTGELDLIAMQGNILVIVEVRSRSAQSAAFGTPAESITPRKIKQVRDTAAVYLHRTSQIEAKIRFDMIGIVMRSNGDSEFISESLEHIVAAF